MGTCLKTQLKSIVNNDNLPLFNVIEFTVSDSISATDENYRMFINRTDPSLTATIIGNGSFRSDSSMSSVIADKTINPNGFVRFTPGNYKIRFSRKYSIFSGNFVTPNSVTYNLDVFKWNQDITAITRGPANWNNFIPNLNKNEVFEIKCDGAEEVANLSLLNGFIKLTTLLVLNNYVSGDIKDWVVAQVKAGRTTNSNGTNFRYCPALRFNGNLITSKSDNIVTWEPTSGGTSITMDGVTIIVDSDGNVIG